MQDLLVFVATWIAVAALVAYVAFRPMLVALWKEPVLKRPVLIIESDDWGAGPLAQALQLDRIASVLAAHSNRQGQKPLMTLGIVLSVPDGERMVSEGLRRYYGRDLSMPIFDGIVAAIKRGIASGVFAPQLHGEAHYWPAALLTAVRADRALAAWLDGAPPAPTEVLPAALQSRWVDATVLPSRPLPVDEVRAAAHAEVASFRSVFGRTPLVAVPPTFIWNDVVESGWAQGGVQFVVTPGRRFEARDDSGNASCAGAPIANGQLGADGLTYLVRDDYFEPARGHRADQAVFGLAAKARLGRPALFETHRSNFIGDAATADSALRELDRLLTRAIDDFPELIFMSTEDLGRSMREQEPQLVELRTAFRIRVWLRRLWALSRLRKLACVTGLIAPAILVYGLTSLMAGKPRPVAR